MFNFCINRDTKPSTCCCGCSVMCGIITIAILNLINVVGAIAGLHAPSIVASILMFLPLAALFVWPKSHLVRKINYILQCICLGMLAVGLIIWVFAIDLLWNLPEAVCKHALAHPDLHDADDQFPELTEENCEGHARKWMYIAWAVSCVLFVPLEVLITSIFKAHMDDCEEEGEAAQY